MRSINEDEAELLIEEHLRMQGWNLTDFTLTRKRWREHLSREDWYADVLVTTIQHLAAR